MPFIFMLIIFLNKQDEEEWERKKNLKKAWYSFKLKIKITVKELFEGDLSRLAGGL